MSLRTARKRLGRARFDDAPPPPDDYEERGRARGVDFPEPFEGDIDPDAELDALEAEYRAKYEEEEARNEALLDEIEAKYRLRRGDNAVSPRTGRPVLDERRRKTAPLVRSSRKYRLPGTGARVMMRCRLWPRAACSSIRP